MYNKDSKSHNIENNIHNKNHKHKFFLLFEFNTIQIIYSSLLVCCFTPNHIGFRKAWHNYDDNKQRNHIQPNHPKTVNLKGLIDGYPELWHLVCYYKNIR